MDGHDASHARSADARQPHDAGGVERHTRRGVAISIEPREETIALVERISVSGRLRSFGFAVRGFGVVLRTQHNAWIHLVATSCVVLLGLCLPLGRTDWGLLCVAIGLVWMAESLNTALELLADATAPDAHPLVRDAKDTAAAGVLCVAIAAVGVGLLVLGPPLLEALRRLCS